VGVSQSEFTTLHYIAKNERQTKQTTE